MEQGQRKRLQQVIAMAPDTRSINRIVALFPKGDTVWQAWVDIIKRYDIRADVTTCTQEITEEPDILLVPLMGMRDGRITPFGLERVKELRIDKKWYDFTPLFLTDQDILDNNNLISSDIADYYKILYEDQQNLDDSIRAVYHAELLFEPPDKDRPWLSTGKKICPCNLFKVWPGDKLSSFIQECWKHISDWKDAVGHEVIKQGRKDFYEYFVKKINWAAYLPKINGKKFSKYSNIFEQIDKWIYDTRKDDEDADQDSSTGHHAMGKLFRQPVPFFFWDFCAEYAIVKEYFSYIAEKNGEDKGKFKMFLLDNIDFTKNGSGDGGKDKSKKNKLNEISDLLKEYKLDSLFEVTQKDENDNSLIFDVKNYINPRHEDSATINNESGKRPVGAGPSRMYFKEQEGQVLLAGPSGRDDQKTEAEINISRYLLVLLDFFLSKSPNHQFLAHRFIRDYNAFKEKNNCFHTDWFFIVSEAYSDVLAYADAGSLSSFSGSTRVDFGDNPLNKKRRIVFLYKLLQLLTGRIIRITGAWEKIEKLYLPRKKDLPHDQDRPCPCSRRKGEKGCADWKRCLDNGIILIHQFKTAYEDEKKLGSDDHAVHTRYDNQFKMANSLENIITDFMWLPEADWPIIQRQIDFLRKNFPDYSFACEYICEELLKRSNIY